MNVLQKTLKISALDGVKNVKKNKKTKQNKTGSCSKKYCFLLHYKQSGRSNISKRSFITYYSIYYFLHKNDHDFYDAVKTVNDFIFSVENKFVSRAKVSVQGSMGLISYQTAEETDQIIELENKSSLLTNVYACVFSMVMFKRK